MKTVTLYTRPGCHLCDDARSALEKLRAEVEFELKEMEGHATNVHYFGGVQFQQFGLHHVEIYLQDELRLRFPLPVVRVVAK